MAVCRGDILVNWKITVKHERIDSGGEVSCLFGNTWNSAICYARRLIRSKKQAVKQSGTIDGMRMGFAIATTAENVLLICIKNVLSRKKIYSYIYMRRSVAANLICAF